MNFYQLPPDLDQDIEKFARQIQDFQEGNLNPAQFKGVRVGFGIYEQRQEGTFMMRIRSPQGSLTPKQFQRIAELSVKYGDDKLHATTRQAFQLTFVDLKDLIAVTRGLQEVGLSGRAGGGNTVRNIVGSYDAGINPTEAFDISPYAYALTSRMLEEPDSYSLPRKLKFSFSGDQQDTAKASLTCVGFIAELQDGKKGFKVFVGGGTGSATKYGKVLLDWIPEHRVYYVAKAVKRMFEEHGNRKQRNRAKIKWLYERLGHRGFEELFFKYYALIQQELGLELQLEPVENRVEVAAGYAAESPDDQAEFEQWKKRYVSEQKQKGQYLIKIPLKGGVLKNEDALSLAKLAENFGENCIRISPDQNFNLKNISLEYLPNVFNQVRKLETLSTAPALLGNMIACTGAANCTLGLTQSRPMMEEVQLELKQRNFDLEQFAQVKFYLSGCPNACGNNHVADIGLFGKALKRNQHIFPAYTIQLGAKAANGSLQTAVQVATVPAKFVPQVMADFLESYSKNAKAHGEITAWLQSETAQVQLRELAKDYEAKIPKWEDDPGFYTDWHTSEPFSLLKGKKAECSAGLFDLIEYDFDKIKELEAQWKTDGSEPAQVARQLTLHASRSLLVTRGIEPGNDQEVFDAFIKDFLEEGLVSAHYKKLVTAAKQEDLAFLAGQVEEAMNLAAHMYALYDSMDDTLRFHLPRQVAKANEVKKNTQAQTDEAGTNGEVATETTQEVKFRDFRGVRCPMNFVKTKIAMDPMAQGELLEILLDDGQPILNVPGSVELEGHEIVQQEQDKQGHWSVLIRKA